MPTKSARAKNVKFAELEIWVPEKDETRNNGAMAEWLIATVLKTVVPKGTGGSNPSRSARKKR